MELEETKPRAGMEAYELIAGERLKIDVGSETVLNELVPEGKVWVISVEVGITERDGGEHGR